MTTRRGFLSGLLAAAAAPSIVRSESLMKLWVPPQDIILPNFAGDFTVESWVKPADGEWVNIAMTRSGSKVTKYINGEAVTDHPLLPMFRDVVVPMVGVRSNAYAALMTRLHQRKTALGDSPLLDDVRVTEGIAREPSSLLVMKGQP